MNEQGIMMTNLYGEQNGSRSGAIRTPDSGHAACKGRAGYNPLLTAPVAESQLRCFAVKVRARSEELVATALREKGYVVFSPTYTEVRRYSDRLRKVSCALFPGYVFVRLDPANLMLLMSTQGVSYIVRTGSGLVPLSPEESKTVEAICLVKNDCQPAHYLRVGQRVMIEAGPMAGLCGVLVKVRDAERVVISVESLHRSVSVEIGHTRVRSLDVADTGGFSAAHSTSA